MSDTVTRKEKLQSSPRQQGRVSATRIDPAHPPIPANAEALTPFESPPDNDSEESTVAAFEIEHLQTQARQLAEHLQSRRRQIDRREAQLNARAAHLEKEERTSLLWFQKTSESLEEQERELHRRKNELTAEASTLADQTQCNKDLTTQLKQTQISLEEQEAALGRREAQTKNAERTLDERTKESVNTISELENSTLLALENKRATLNRKTTQLQREQSALTEHRASFEEMVQRTTRELQSQGAVLSDKEKSLEKEAHDRREEIDRKQSMVEKLRVDVLEMHRETLEMRLVAEQLWSELSEKTNSVKLTQSLSGLRSQLADHFKLAEQSLQQQKEEISTLAASLKERQTAITGKKKELQEWLQRRQQELEEQAARLVAKENKLEQEAFQLAQKRSEWPAERHELKERIVELESAFAEQPLTKSSEPGPVSQNAAAK